MALNYVTLTVDMFDGQGNPLSGGGAVFTPSVRLTDATDHEIVTQAPLSAAFSAAASPVIKLLATDNANVLPAGWAWTVTFPGASGSPAGFSFFLPFASGASQNLSAISPASTAVTQFPANPMTAAGDMIIGSASPAGTPARLPVGTANQVLTVVNGTPAWGSASAASLPLTTLGDLLYENATPTPARLPGNTTAAKQFLTQTGTGSASAAPAWGAIAAGDVPTLNQNTTGSSGSCTGNAATATNLAGGAAVPAWLAPHVVTLTDAATVAVNAALGNDLRLLTTSAVGATRAVGAPSNPADGQVLTIDIQQDATGSRVVTWASGAGGYSFGADGSPTLSTGANAVDTIGFRYHGGLGKWICLGWKLGFS